MANCQICGKPSGFFPLCKKCNDLKEEGKIIKCEDCNTWHYVDKPCNCKTSNKPSKKEETNIINGDKPIKKCLLCDNETETEDYLFCKKCYYKYKDKEITIKISNCTDIELLDIDYKGKKFTSEDGHVLRSLGELLIDNYLYNENIKHSYERGYYITKTIEIKPDWYLPKYDLFIEHWGINNSEKYNKQKEFKLKHYLENKKTVICTYEKDLQNLSTELERKLNPDYYKKNTINFLKD